VDGPGPNSGSVVADGPGAAGRGGRALVVGRGAPERISRGDPCSRGRSPLARTAEMRRAEGILEAAPFGTPAAEASGNPAVGYRLSPRLDG